MKQPQHRLTYLTAFLLGLASHWTQFTDAQVRTSPATRSNSTSNQTEEDDTATQAERNAQDVEALRNAGIGCYLSSDGSVFSVKIVSDQQFAKLPPLPRLHSVQLSGDGVTNAGLKRLAELTQVQSVDIERCAADDGGLVPLRQMNNLKSMTLSGGWFTAEGVRALKHIPTLKRLHLLTTVDLSILQSLSEVRQIDSLVLSASTRMGIPLSEQAIDVMNTYDFLTRFSVSWSEVGPEDLHQIGRLEIPFSLSIHRSPDLTKDSWKELAGTRLLDLSVSGTSVTDAALEHIGAVRMLETLHISNAPVSNSGLVHLRNLKALKNIAFRNTSVTEEEAKKLQEVLPNVRIVSTSGTNRNTFQQTRNEMSFLNNPRSGERDAFLRSRLTAADIDRLKSEPNLGTVFSGEEMRNEDLQLLADVPLTGLVIQSAHVTDRGVELLADHPTLEHLALWSASITDRALESITKISRLNRLAIQRTPISGEGVNGLVERLAEKGQIKWLNLFKCPHLTDEGLRQVGRLTSLERLLLNSNDLLTSAIIEDISRLKNLNRLELDGISLEESRLAHLASLTNLETLGLSSGDRPSQLTDEGVKHLTELPSLRALTIQEAKITDESARFLTQIKTLRELGLARTGVSDHCVRDIAEALPHLTRLNLSGTKVTDAGMVSVGKLTQLEWLWLDETGVGEDGLQQLDALSKLEHIYINAANVSSEGHQRLRRQHPATDIRLK